MSEINTKSSLIDEESEDLRDFQDVALLDTLKALGPMSQDEESYYKNL